MTQHQAATRNRQRLGLTEAVTSARYDGLPGEDFPGAPDSYPGKDQVADYLTDYARRHAFPILTDTQVSRLVRHQADSQRTPPVASYTPGRWWWRPARSTCRPGRPSTGPSPSRPRTSRSTAVPATCREAGCWWSAVRTPASRSPRTWSATGRWCWPPEPTRPRYRSGRSAGTCFWRLTRLVLMDKGPDSRLAKRMRARGDLVVGSSRKDLRDAGVDFRPRLVHASGRTATFADGTAVDVHAVVSATGFRPDYTWIDAPELTDEAGMPRHDGGRSLAVPGLWFLGLP